MELLYLWIEKYKNIEKQGFNFSSQYRFTFDYQEDKDGKVIGGELKVEENPNYIPGFFPEGISNVTAIIGENGAGKSSLLEVLRTAYLQEKIIFVLKDFSSDKNKLKPKIFYSFKNQPTLTEYSFIHITPTIFNQIHLPYFKLYKHIGDEPDMMIFYTSIFKGEPFTIPGINEDMLDPKSPTYYFNYELDSLLSEGIINYKFKETQRHIIFLRDEDNLKILPFHNRPHSISLYPIYPLSRPFWIQGLQTNDQQKIKAIVDKEIYNCDNIKEFFLSNFRWTFFFELNSYIATNNLQYHFVISEDLQNAKDFLDNILESNISNIKPYLDKAKKEIQNFIDYIERFVEDVIERKDYFFTKDLIYNSHIRFKLDDENKIFQPELLENFYNTFWKYYSDVLQFYSSSRDSINILSLKWEGLSSGEIAFLNIFSIIYSIKSNNIGNSDVFLILDEPDVYLHPQWQKEFLNKLMNFVSNQYKYYTYESTSMERQGKIHIILTSHSPFIASDLPKDNIIFLRKGDEKDGDLENKCIVVKEGDRKYPDLPQTFGQNIHTLLADSFFMDGGLIGDFAKHKINSEIIEIINKYKETKTKISQNQAENLAKKIEMIGEPLIKRKLTSMLEEVIKITDKDIQRAYYQRKLNQLDEE